MTVYQTVPTVISGDSWSASQHNTYVRDNFKSIMEAGTAGALLYFQTANNVAAISPSTSGNILQSNGTAWSSVAQSLLTAIPGLLHTKGIVSFAPGGQSSSASGYIDITGGSLSLVLTRVCTVVVDAVVTGYHDLAGAAFMVRASVAGTVDPTTNLPFNGGAVRNEALAYTYYATGVAAGTITVKMQFVGGAGNTTYVERGRMRVLAFVES